MKHAPFGFDEPEQSPGFSLWQTTTSWQRQIKKSLEPHNISHAQFVLLAILLWRTSCKEETTQADLVTQSKLDKMTVSKSLRILVENNLIDRFENPKDTRAKSVCLTAKGKALAQQLVPVVEAVDSVFFGKLEKEEQQSLTGILNKLSKEKN